VTKAATLPVEAMALEVAEQWFAPGATAIPVAGFVRGGQAGDQGEQSIAPLIPEQEQVDGTKGVGLCRPFYRSRVSPIFARKCTLRGTTSGPPWIGKEKRAFVVAVLVYRMG
jgi:hypothetical protein